MTCPQCTQRIPAIRLWTATNVSGVVCPNCNASLCPGAICAVVITIVAFGAGELALLLLRRAGVEIWLAIGAFVAVAVLVYLFLGPLMIRLHVKGAAAASMTHRRA